MFLELTGTGMYNRLVIINSDKIIYFERHNGGTRLWLDSNDGDPVDVAQSLDFIMEYLQD